MPVGALGMSTSVREKALDKRTYIDATLAWQLSFVLPFPFVIAPSTDRHPALAT